MNIMDYGKISATLGAFMLAATAAADPIVIDYLGDGVSDDGGNVGGYSMTDIDQQANTDPGNTTDDVSCINSTGVTGTVSANGSSGNICFQGQGGTLSDIDIIDNPIRNGTAWWQFPTQGNVYVTNKNWIEILLPENTFAVSLWVGASFNGSAWIGAYNTDGDYVQTAPNFSVGPGKTKGYGVYAGDSCSALTKIIVEPKDWGFGNLSISQGSCVSVPEPGPLVLLLLGMLGIAVNRRYSRTA
ncbi:MAG: PEP-CTERM sorting domain-containing protein [Woeseiaceae bacterium]|nr:PEP-CTERM sorting domain-containing protein [Woeseiaceae bacterium]